MLVQAEKSSLLTSIVLGKREADKKLPPSQVWKTISPHFLGLPCLLQIPGYYSASPQLLWSESKVTACCPNDMEGWEMGGVFEPTRLPLALQLG